MQLLNPDEKTRRTIYRALIIYWLLLLVATSLPSRDVPSLFGSDKVKHFSAYAVLAMMLTAALLLQEKSFYRKYAFPGAILFTSLYGLADELHQIFIPGRECEFYDWLADFSGAITGTLIIYLYYSYQKRKAGQSSPAG